MGFIESSPCIARQWRTVDSVFQTFRLLGPCLTVLPRLPGTDQAGWLDRHWYDTRSRRRTLQEYTEHRMKVAQSGRRADSTRELLTTVEPAGACVVLIPFRPGFVLDV